MVRLVLRSYHEAEMRILVVDDSAAVRARLVPLLRDVDGVELVAEADDTARAVSLARVMSPHLVFLDLDLHGKSGLAILRALKDKADAPIVVILTNHAGDVFAAHCRALGADHFFDKSSQFHLAIDVARANVAQFRRPL
jgi:DNA-binding NarL/FixJ family response regulator